ncbi:MAG: hypothetical protein ABMB14_35775 [Myxococcota bacterium]
MILTLIACTAGTTNTLPGPHSVVEVGNPERVIGVATYLPPEVPDVPPTIDTAWAALHETKLILDETYAGTEELEWETPDLIADLALGIVDLAFESPDAGYNRVEVRPRTGRARPPGAPPELEDASFVIDGHRSDGVPFRILSDTEDEIALTGAFQLGEDQSALALGFDLNTWFEGIDLDAATVKGNGEIEISHDENRGLLDRFERNLAGSVALVDDQNGDGFVDDGEPVLTSSGR